MSNNELFFRIFNAAKSLAHTLAAFIHLADKDSDENHISSAETQSEIECEAASLPSDSEQINSCKNAEDASVSSPETEPSDEQNVTPIAEEMITDSCNVATES